MDYIYKITLLHNPKGQRVRRGAGPRGQDVAMVA